jgi:glycyl-tRNA synthetase (class II)
MPGRFSSSRWALYTRCDVGFGRSAQAEELKEPRLILMMNQDVTPREMAVLPLAERHPASAKAHTPSEDHTSSFSSAALINSGKTMKGN